MWSPGVRIALTPFILAAACGSTTAAGGVGSDFWTTPGHCLRVTVNNVEVMMGEPDGSMPEADESPFCALLGLAVSVASASLVGTGITSVCSALTALERRQQQHLPEAPDLAVGIEVEGQILHQSPTLFDSYAGTLGHSILLPAGSVPTEGIKLAVLDVDEGAAPQMLGSFRVTRTHLDQLRGAGLQRLADFGPNVGSLELTLEEYAPPEPQQFVLAARDGQRLLPLSIPAGAVVRVAVSGRYRFSQRRTDPEIGPEGWPGSAGHDGNRQVTPLRGALHAAAYAGIGDGVDSEVFLVPACVRIMSAPAGFLLVGINDQGNTRDNSGELTFSVAITVPTPEEWSKATSLVGCAE